MTVKPHRIVVTKTLKKGDTIKFGINTLSYEFKAGQDLETGQIADVKKDVLYLAELSRENIKLDLSVPRVNLKKSWGD